MENNDVTLAKLLETLMQLEAQITLFCQKKGVNDSRRQDLINLSAQIERILNSIQMGR
jgi:hypothetical protein